MKKLKTFNDDTFWSKTKGEWKFYESGTFEYLINSEDWYKEQGNYNDDKTVFYVRCGNSAYRIAPKEYWGNIGSCYWTLNKDVSTINDPYVIACINYKDLEHLNQNLIIDVSEFTQEKKIEIFSELKSKLSFIEGLNVKNENCEQTPFESDFCHEIDYIMFDTFIRSFTRFSLSLMSCAIAGSEEIRDFQKEGYTSIEFESVDKVAKLIKEIFE